MGRELLRAAMTTMTTTCLLDADATKWRTTSVSVIPTSAPSQDALSTLEFGLAAVAPACVMGWWEVKIALLKIWKMPRFALSRMLLPALLPLLDASIGKAGVGRLVGIVATLGCNTKRLD